MYIILTLLKQNTVIYTDATILNTVISLILDTAKKKTDFLIKY